jgi:spermidine synthase
MRRSPAAAALAGPSRSSGSSITLSECDGVRFLHFGTAWVQGAMRINRPFALEIAYQRQMMAPLLFIAQPRRILQLGLGAAALTKFCHRYVRSAAVVVVDVDPAVVRAARRWFRLPPDDTRLQVVTADAAAWLRANARGRGAGFDWLQVDVYDAAARGPVYDDAAFYRRCRAAMNAPAVAAFNLFGSRFERSVAAIAQAFDDRVAALPPIDEGNRIVLGFCGPPLRVSFAQLFEAAAVLEADYRLPLRDWAAGLRRVGAPAADAAACGGAAPRGAVFAI